MRIPPHLAWLFWASPYLNAFHIPLYLQGIEGNQALLQVLVPRNKHVDVPPNGIFFLTLRAKDAKKFPKSARLGEAHKVYAFDLFSFVNLEKELKLSHSRAVVIKWSDLHGHPMMKIISVVPAAVKNAFYDLGKTEEQIGPIDASIVANQGPNAEYAKGSVYFRFSQYHSSFPDWAYDLLIKAFPRPVVKHPVVSINCDKIEKMELPTFLFTIGNTYFAQLTKDNYFVPKGPGNMCYLAAQLRTGNDWIIGAALSRTIQTVFAISSKSGNLGIHFIIPPSMDTKITSTLAVTV